MNEQRRHWTQGQQEMRRLLIGGDRQEGIALWLRRHAARGIPSSVP